VSSADQAAEPFRFDRGRLTLLLVPIGALIVMANIGTALAPTLVNHHPALLITLDARNRHLLLVVAAGIGVSVVPASMRGFHMESVVYCRLDDAAGLHAPITLAYLDANRNPAATNFIALARKHASAIKGRRRR
jgi:hypothetical protein